MIPVSAECRVCEMGYHAVYNLDAGLDSLGPLLQLAGFSSNPLEEERRTAGDGSKSKLLGIHHHYRTMSFWKLMRFLILFQSGRFS